MSNGDAAAEVMCFFIEGHSCYEVVRDFAGPISTTLIFFLGVWFAWFKLWKQHKDAIKQHDLKSKKELEINFFNEIDQILFSAQNCVTGVIVFCNTKRFPKPGTEEAFFTIEEFLDQRKILSSALLEIALRIEAREVMHPLLFKTFRIGISSLTYDLSTFKINSKTEELLDLLQDCAHKADCYISDFQICLQNKVWGVLFENRLPDRKPLDPSYKVIIDEEKSLTELLKFFEEETEMGKAGKKSKEDVIARLAKEGAQEQ